MRPRAKVISKTMDLDTVMLQKKNRTGTASAFWMKKVATSTPRTRKAIRFGVIPFTPIRED
jgi:hypothetical protein